MTKLSEDFPGDQLPHRLPKHIACDPCMLKLGQHMQSTPYSNYGEALVDSWVELQKLCGVQYPTEVIKVNTDHVQLPNFAPKGYYTSTECISGHTYKVASGDDCAKISTKKGVATDILISINGLLPDCSNLKGMTRLDMVSFMTDWVS